MTTLAQVKPTLTELVPWTDRRGRFDRVRAGVFLLLLLPGLWLGCGGPGICWGRNR